LKLCTVKHLNTYYSDSLFEKTINSIADLTDNYQPLNLDKYMEYGYMSENNEIVAMCGITDFGYGCYRVESSCWINPKYRTSLFQKDSKYNHYALSHYQMEKFEDSVKLWFKSRIAKNPAGIARVVPKGWKVFPRMIELCWKDNWQWVVYKGDINENLATLETPNHNSYSTH